MRDQLTGTSHHIGIAGVSRLDPRDDLAYVSEIYFCSEDTDHISRKLLDGDGEAYVRLGTANKIDWAEIRLTLQGCLKRRRGPVMHCLVLLLGKSALETGDLDPVEPVRIDCSQFSYRRRYEYESL